MTRITTHLRGGEHVTIIRAPGDPMPAWLGGGDDETPISYAEWCRMSAVHVFGETPTLPTTEERT